jgi:alkylation response protein AidB-like acyl-CoA dehydrogenase
MLYDIDRSEETVSVTELGRALAIDLLDPIAAEVERTGSIPPVVFKTLVDTGLICPVAESFGGGGVPSAAAHLHFVSALAHGDPTCAAAAVWAGSAALVAHYLDDEDLLRQLGDRPTSVALGLHEGFGRSPHEFHTRVSDVVAGHKVAVCWAGQPTDVLVVGVDGCAVLDADPSPPRSHMLGLGATQLADLSLVGQRSRLIPRRDQANLGISHVRLLNAALLLGTAQRATEYAASYANERIAFGKPISSFQGVSFMLAEAALRIGAAHLEMIDTAWQIDAGDLTDLELRTTRAVNYAGQVAMEATRDAIQVLGGHGFITDHPVERWYRAAATIAAIDCDPLLHPFAQSL